MTLTTDEEYEAALEELSILMEHGGPYSEDPQILELAKAIEMYENAHLPSEWQ